MRVKDKVALVTGAGSGIGQATAKVLAQEGASVVVNARSPEKGRETLRLIKQVGGQGIVVGGDVSVAADVQRMVRQAVEAYGALHVLVNNAGVNFRTRGDGPVTTTPEELWDTTIAVNLKGPFLCCKYAIPHMIKAGSGSIINISSMAAVIGIGASAYTASKGGLASMTRSLASHYGKHNIRANCLLMGSIDTGILEVVPAGDMEKRLSRNILPRIGRPEEPAMLVLYLASDESAYVTGAMFSIDGGATAL